MEKETRWSLTRWYRDALAAKDLPDPRGILSRPVRNDPALFTPVSVRAIRAFYVKGRRVGVGEVVEVPKHLAAELDGVKTLLL
ncbi:MAG: hypothetical protein A2V83_00555 [Nitrospirae bacterium RBG_16_64_22]|nr:MAG: hypothetical protein A2V83_00555 [Nitrospirae bacterium RBG_16_64_22]